MSALNVRTGLAAALAVVFVFAAGSAPVRAGSLIGDANGDGVVDVEDLRIVLELWGHKYSAGDVNGDGIVDFEDVLLVLQNWT